MKAAHADPRRGFSLIEVLVAMAIFTIGATSILALFAAAAATHKRSVDRTRAALVAEQVIAEARARYLPGTEPGDLMKAVSAAVPETIDGYRWTLRAVRPSDASSPGARDGRRPPAGPRPTRVVPTARARPAPTSDDSEGKPPAWSEEELAIRVGVGWSQGGRAVTETYDTVILPRPAPFQKGEKRGRR